MAAPNIMRQHDSMKAQFKSDLEHNWTRVAACGNKYIHMDAVKRWMTQSQPNGNETNAMCLLQALEPEISRHHHIAPHGLRKIVEGNRPCLIILSILLSQDRGHLVDIFHEAQFNDDNLEDISPYRSTKLRELLKKKGFQNASDIIEDFEKAKWAFCPAPLELGMQANFRTGSIVPFCRKVLLNPTNPKGGTATVYQVAVQKDHFIVPDDIHKGAQAALQRSAYFDPDFGECYRFALKSYPAKNSHLYGWERAAYIALRNEDTMVKYFGDYSISELINGREEETHNILLEFGGMDLDEYFAHERNLPPVLSEEIIRFWKSLFEIAEALRAMHELLVPSEVMQSVRKYHGWHADVKPDNILMISERFKLADFGFAKFREQGLNIPTESIEGGTETFGAPEVDRYRTRGTKTEVMQTIDIWSYGCVLSVAATWVVLGWQGIEQFETHRRLAVEKARKRQEQASSARQPAKPNRGPRKAKVPPTADDAFHDGYRVLDEIKDWHDYLRGRIRKSDTITDSVLELVENSMLLQNAQDRISSEDLCWRLDEQIHMAQWRLEKLIGEQKIKPTNPSVLQSLQAFEGLASQKQASQESTSSTRHTRTQVSTLDGITLLIPSDRPTRMSSRQGKLAIVSRPFGKTLHRDDILEQKLGDKRVTVAAMEEETNPSAVTSEHKADRAHMSERAPLLASGAEQSQPSGWEHGGMPQHPRAGYPQTFGGESSASSRQCHRPSPALPNSHLEASDGMMFTEAQSESPAQIIDQAPELADVQSGLPLFPPLPGDEEQGVNPVTTPPYNPSPMNSPRGLGIPSIPSMPHSRAETPRRLTTPDQAVSEDAFSPKIGRPHVQRLSAADATNHEYSQYLSHSAMGHGTSVPERTMVSPVQSPVPNQSPYQPPTIPRSPEKRGSESDKQDEQADTPTAKGKAPAVGRPLQERPDPRSTTSFPTCVGELPNFYDIARTRWEVEQGKPKGLQRMLERSKEVITRNPKKDQMLAEHVGNRDIVFVIDNGSTMHKFRYTAAFIVETLAMKLGPLDEDGLDVVFTIGQGMYDMKKVRGSKAPGDIKKKMATAWPQEGQEKLTDMGPTLGKLYKRYSDEKKPMTLIVITDGIWEGTTPPQKVETEFVDFMKTLPYTPEKRQLTIQFVRLGNDRAAIDRLNFLDDGLEEKYRGTGTFEDIIDHVSWTQSVLKIVVGSLSDNLDRTIEPEKHVPDNIEDLFRQFYYNPSRYLVAATGSKHGKSLSSSALGFSRTATGQSSLSRRQSNRASKGFGIS